MNRSEYMDSTGLADYSTEEGKAQRWAKHREYYGQFVNEHTIAYVNMVIGRGRLLGSTDPNLNDIPLGRWDNLATSLPLAARFKDFGDFPSLGGLVCIAKEAARQWIERQS